MGGSTAVGGLRTPSELVPQSPLHFVGEKRVKPLSISGIVPRMKHLPFVGAVAGLAALFVVGVVAQTGPAAPQVQPWGANSDAGTALALTFVQEQTRNHLGLTPLVRRLPALRAQGRFIDTRAWPE